MRQENNRNMGSLDMNNNMPCVENDVKFGIMFDIDGVLLRGKTPIPNAKEAIHALLDESGTKFAVPTVFCTNGFGLREVKAATLSEKLQVDINSDQIVMSQSPLEMFHEFHDKWCLISGPDHDGGSVKVAKSLGFQKILTIDDVSKAYPYLDWVDRRRWPKDAVENDETFPTIEAVILLGEPIRWETNLQLIIDVLLTNGRPSEPPGTCEDGHLPILAVNMDLQWMAKASIPRFGHGAFMVCLENLFEKITGMELHYTALIGKPSEITYEYSQKLMEEIANGLNVTEINTVYAIGDNPLTDIYGANMFNRYLIRKKEEIEQRVRNLQIDDGSHLKKNDDNSLDRSTIPNSHFSLLGDIANVRGVKRCDSILVCTGVYQPSESSSSTSSSVCSVCTANSSDQDEETEQEKDDIVFELNSSSPPVRKRNLERRFSFPQKSERRRSIRKSVDHGHRDLPFAEDLTKAGHIVHDVKEAIDKICSLESWQPKYKDEE